MDRARDGPGARSGEANSRGPHCYIAIEPGPMPSVRFLRRVPLRHRGQDTGGRMIEFAAAQKKAIGLDALDLDTCVVAGPGSGKTTVLIERFRGMVESGVSPLRILAITFTEKATNQTRERLAGAFADRPDLILQIPRAYVSTVHGFCTRLLRENAI